MRKFIIALILAVAIATVGYAQQQDESDYPNVGADAATIIRTIINDQSTNSSITSVCAQCGVSLPAGQQDDVLVYETGQGWIPAQDIIVDSIQIRPKPTIPGTRRIFEASDYGDNYRGFTIPSSLTANLDWLYPDALPVDNTLILWSAPAASISFGSYWTFDPADFTLSGGVISYTGSGGGGGQVNSVIAGEGMSVNSSDPANPIVINEGVVDTVAGTNITIDKTDPKRPVISSTASGGGTSHTIVVVSSDKTLLAAEQVNSTILYNALAEITAVTGVVGSQLRLYINDAIEGKFYPEVSEVIRLVSTSLDASNGISNTSAALGDYIDLTCISTGVWATTDSRGTWGDAGPPSGGAICTDEETWTGDSEWNSLASSSIYTAFVWEATATFDHSEFEIEYRKNNSPTADLVVEVRTSTATGPTSTVLGTTTINMADFPGSAADHKIVIAANGITTGSLYAYVWYRSDLLVDAVNNISFRNSAYNGHPSNDTGRWTSDDDVTWSTTQRRRILKGVARSGVCP